MTRYGCAIWIVLGIACDEPGGRSAFSVAPEVGDTGGVVDGAGDTGTADTTTAGDDSGAPVETVADTLVPDTTPPDTTPAETVAPDTTAEVEVGECQGGCLPVSAAGAPTGVVYSQFASQPRPILRGGEAPDGEWVLTRIVFYTLGTFATGISVSFQNNGQTAGRVAFDADQMAMALDLDMLVTVSAFGSSGSDSARSPLAFGGCHSISGARIEGSFGECGSGLGGGTAQGAIEFEHGPGTLAIGVEIPREALIALLPPDQRESAELAIVGSMYLVTSFGPP